MRLNKVKLVGFKSFVDSTTLELKDSLTAVVGPNGCGKSNIIDAVRWVMGESSAKHLRGESMSDVIFNGSSARKPVGQATVELVFDNSEGKAGGEYAKFNEISVKRMAQRDGKSDYFLNNTKCRKKDIVDVFLGTGLGPRSYSIIEQGMVSRVIEAKPEDLRHFLEEAAGISLYKRRRHETQLRINHTKENLDRVADILTELNKQLAKLERQAAAAEQYVELKKQANEIEAEIYIIQWQKILKLITEQQDKVQKLIIVVEQKNSHKTKISTDIDTAKLEFNDKNDAVNKIQEECYAIKANIGKIETSIAHFQEKMQQMSADLATLGKDIENYQNRKVEDQKVKESLLEEKSIIEPQLQEANSKLDDLYTEAKTAENNYSNSSKQWDEFQVSSRKLQQQAEGAKVKIAQLEQRITEASSRNNRLKSEKECLDTSELSNEILSLTKETEDKKAECARINSDIDNNEKNLTALLEKQDDLHLSISQKQTIWQKLQGKYESLCELQKAALKSDNQEFMAWLKSNGLEANKKLLQKIKVSAGWEVALAAGCGALIDSIWVDDVSKHHHIILDAEKKSEFEVKLFSPTTNTNDTNSGKINLPKLLEKVIDGEGLSGLLENVFCCDSLDLAIPLIKDLASNQIIVTKSGTVVAKNWIKTSKPEDLQLTSVKREQEIEKIKLEISKIEAEQHKLNQEKERLNDEIINAKNHIKQAKKQSHELQNILNQRLQSLNAKNNKLEQISSRINTIDKEIKENLNIIAESESQVKESRTYLASSLDDMSGFNDKSELLQKQRDSHRDKMQEANSNLARQKDKVHELQIGFNTVSNKIQANEENIARLINNIKNLEDKQLELTTELSNSDAPISEYKNKLAELLDSKSKLDISLSQAQDTKQDVENRLKDLEAAQIDAQNQLDDSKEELSQARIRLEGTLSKKETLQESMLEFEIDIESASKHEVDAQQLQDKQAMLKDLNLQISKLGAVNLAAVEEFKSESARKEHLQAQYDDLNKALLTLEDAIAKIDKESKEKFKGTYDKVNSGFKTLFPKLFGGGQAYLELIGDDLLQAQVNIIARPPGKKNSSIHLLSGGEKALTAVALVFSIFQLNPAPFCVLDEVDAPLDDANVGRFCEMLKEMSSKVQFIFITHNKITMETANTLAGVTMKEPGVSRLVTVNVAEAAAMID